MFTPKLVVNSSRDSGSGIHDPAGPTGSWGAGEGNARKEKLAQEQAFGIQKKDVASEALRSEQRSGHSPGHVSVSKVAAVDNEMEEMADEKADEEYSHMGRIQKWIMEVKAALYSWLRSGLEL